VELTITIEVMTEILESG